MNDDIKQLYQREYMYKYCYTKSVYKTETEKSREQSINLLPSHSKGSWHDRDPGDPVRPEIC